jgi:hypothetical protein
MHEHLVRRFADAGLPLVLMDRPIVGNLMGARDAIVQIDIQRKVNGSRRQEWFRIFPGADTNRIEVVGTDKKFGQVVVLVHEPPREFTESVGTWGLRDVDLTQANWKDALATKLAVRADAIRPHYGHGNKVNRVDIVRRTPSTKRHFLMGLDERQLFVCQLPKAVSTVREAHACLKATTVDLAEGKGIKARRQGEWFFIEASHEEVRQIEYGLKKNQLVVEFSVPIGPFTIGGIRGKKVRQFRGNPHTADELVVIPGLIRGREVFIRGRVRHIDHATVKFTQWHKVIRNTEPNQGQALGVGWVD